MNVFLKAQILIITYRKPYENNSGAATWGTFYYKSRRFQRKFSLGSKESNWVLDKRFKAKIETTGGNFVEVKLYVWLKENENL